jgi:hypothetical protein
MVTTFGNVSLVAVPANVMAEPAAGLVMTLGLTTGLLSGLVREELAWVLQVPVRVAVWWVDQVAAMGAELAIPPSGVFAWAVIVGASLWSVHLWRTRGSAMIGRVAAVALIPMVVFLRPPLSGAGEVTSVDDGIELRGTCAGWLLHMGDSSMDERTGVELLELLWQMGITRVALVTVEATAKEDAAIEDGQELGAIRVLPVGQQHTGAEMVASELRAPLAAVTTGMDVTDAAGVIAAWMTDDYIDAARDPPLAVPREPGCS